METETQVQENFIEQADVIAQGSLSEQEMIERINAAYDDFPDEEEQALLKAMRRKYRGYNLE